MMHENPGEPRPLPPIQTLMVPSEILIVNKKLFL